jgi:hypothetical protein
MRARSIVIFVIVVTFVTPAETILDARSPRAVYQDDDSVMETAAYSVYERLLPGVRTFVSKEPIPLQRETERSAGCEPPLTGWDAEWKPVERAYRQENARVRSLRPLLQTPVPYRLIPKSEIIADDARIALKYPGLRQGSRPESIEFAAVTAVGFNASETKALVGVRIRLQGWVVRLELRDGVWATVGGGCLWIA